MGGYLKDEKDIRRAIVRAITAMWLLLLLVAFNLSPLLLLDSGHQVKLQGKKRAMSWRRWERVGCWWLGAGTRPAGDEGVVLRLAGVADAQITDDAAAPAHTHEQRQ